MTGHLSAKSPVLHEGRGREVLEVVLVGEVVLEASL